MDQSPKICSKCQQANFPIAEFCRHCGEPIFEMGSLSRTSFFSRWLGHVIDGMSWVVDEFMRWWEIGRLNRELKTLRRRRSELMAKSGANGKSEPEAIFSHDRDKVVTISEEMSRLSTREEFLRKRSWGLSPELFLLALIIAFIGGLIWLKPRTGIPLQQQQPASSFRGNISKVAEIPIAGHSVVTCAAWHEDKLYIGGDGGLTLIDPVNSVATQVALLPTGFFVRHLLSDGNRLLIAGYGGVFALDRSGISPVYEGIRLPVDLVNRIALTKDGGHLLGTVGHGLLKGRNGVSVVVLGTQGKTLLSFEWLAGELWILHEWGIMKGDGSSFSPVPLQVLAGRALTSMAIGNNTIFIGSKSGLVAGYQNDNNWVWTPIGGNEPKSISDLIINNGVLLICSNEGLFRSIEGNIEKLISVPNQRVIAAGQSYLATAGPQKAILYRFAGESLNQSQAVSVLPSVGTFATNLPAGNVSAVQPQTTSPAPLQINPAPTLPVQNQVPPLPVQVVSAQPTPTIAPQQPVTPPPVFPPPTQGIPTLTNSSGFLKFPLPTILNGPFASALAWDGSRLWVGTSNDGLWVFSNNQWSNLSTANGGLSDNQIVSLWVLRGKVFLYSWILGILSVDTGRAVPALTVDKTSGFQNMAGDPGSPMFLFEGGYIRKLNSNGTIEQVSRIPEDFFKSSRSLQVVNGQPMVITDQGVLSQDSNGRWLVTFFPDVPSGTKALFSALSKEGVVYAALSDGTIYSFIDRKVAKVGSIGERPRGLIFADTLWTAGANSIFRLKSGALVPLPIGLKETIMNFQVIPEKQLIILATSQGLKDVAIVQ